MSRKKDIEKAFLLALYIPMNVLKSDYWKKSFETRLPKFVDDCIELFESLEYEHISWQEIVDYINANSDITITDIDWIYKNDKRT